MKNRESIQKIILEILDLVEVTEKSVHKIFLKYTSETKRVFKKSKVLSEYRKLKSVNKLNLTESEEKKLLKVLRLKKTRTISGVTPVTVLTKPYPCPGECIYCPGDLSMPKSYLRDEPGAQRAEANKFDPYLQTYNRLVTYNDIGHPTDKVELIILGGTWTVYPEEYQIWFVKRCFDAMNDFNPDIISDKKEVDVEMPYNEEEVEEGATSDYSSKISKILKRNEKERSIWEELSKSQKINEKSKTRCVGLVVETRPDFVTEEELKRIRRLGGTKIQVGVQSLDDEILKLNKRGHTSEQTKAAFSLIRQAGFKIHAHWMPNLLGSNVEKDIKDFKKLFSDKCLKPDELKIYPCSLINGTKLMDYYKKGKWKPYSEQELLKVLKSVIMATPRYCRITRVVRDISSDDIVAGNKKTNFRQIVEKELLRENKKPKEIRFREIRNKDVNVRKSSFKITEYKTDVSTEYFIEYICESDIILGFLRLSLPHKKPFMSELDNSAIIREVHIYGRSIRIGSEENAVAQHMGLGRNLIEKAEKISRKHGFSRISIISAVGTKEYYRNIGYKENGLYMQKVL
ncbi:tRNA uridine(34) 5-carboxymethylaminomethyl modification radical SAM/GNAT enzyme Elp3 [Patescibacteria group bacterium]|nr:tRNA uridine(34) 5-carboxymethylaminomethyl modification radical SAM/GNAT enzyme Elp3 [Patescibacteria group bacterium]